MLTLRLCAVVALLAALAGLVVFDIVPHVREAYNIRRAENAEDHEFIRDSRDLAARFPRRMARTVTEAKRDVAVDPIDPAMRAGWSENTLARHAAAIVGWLSANAFRLIAMLFVLIFVVEPILARLVVGTRATSAEPSNSRKLRINADLNTGDLSRLFSEKHSGPLPPGTGI